MPYTPHSATRRYLAWLPCIAALVALVLATDFEASTAAPANGVTAAQRAAWQADFHRPDTTPYPDDNPYSPAKVELGHKLFFDPVLSGSGKLACASCHKPNLSWTDGRKTGEGEQEMATHTPTLLDIAWIDIMGWDGHFPSLEKVAFGPINNPAIMNRKTDDLLAALRANPNYVQAFAEAFPGQPISRETIEQALATFERMIVASPAPFDRWIAGDEAAIDASAKRGFDLFNGKAGCAECHSGWNFTDGAFYDIGVGQGNDIGRAKLFPNSPKLKYAFKVPTLRDVARRAPYMHNGSEPTLEAVIELYNRGGVDRESRSELIKPLNLTAQDKADLIAFLKTLTSDPKPVAVSELPR
jgi:cytochrome c peroxidase